MPFAVGLALALSAVTGQTAAVASTIQMPPPQAQTVQEYVASYFADIPVMADIARCESQYRQFDKDGSVHRGVVNHADVGIMQINEFYHGDVAKKMGLDLYTLDGNVSYARSLYEKEGVTPWNSSKPCWGKTVAAKAEARKEIALNK